MNSSSNSNQAKIQLVVPTPIRFHCNGKLVAEGILEYIDQVYSVVTMDEIPNVGVVPEEFRALKKGQQFAIVNDILEMYPKTKDSVTTWAGRVSIKVGGQWRKMIEPGKSVDLNDPVDLRKRLCKEYLELNATNKKKKEAFLHLFQSRDENSDEEASSEDEDSNDTPFGTETSDGTINTPLPSIIPVPTKVRFFKENKTVIEGELLFVDSQISVVKVMSIADSSIEPFLQKGALVSRIGLILDLLFRRKGRGHNRWAGRVAIMVNEKWQLIKYKDQNQTAECFTREYMINHCVNGNKREQYNGQMLMSDLSKKRPRGSEDDSNSDYDDVSDCEKGDQNYDEPSPKKVRTDETLSPTKAERRVTRNNPQSPTIEPQSEPESESTDQSMAPLELVIALVEQIDLKVEQKEKAISELQQEVKALRERKEQIKNRLCPIFNFQK